MAKSQIVGIIPARFASTRFPGKMLHPIVGKPLLQHVWQRCLKARELSDVIIATDDQRIATAATSFGATVALTRSTHQSGTDRIAEVASRLKGVTHVLNIQGDEPTINPALIDRLARTMREDRTVRMVTASTPLTESVDILDPNCVKVVTDRQGDALYFSRSPIPCNRDGIPCVRHHLHLGIYGYAMKDLLAFVGWKRSPLEKAEQLEQLRALENGLKIRVISTKRRSFGIDTPEDAIKLENLLKK